MSKKTKLCVCFVTVGLLVLVLTGIFLVNRKEKISYKTISADRYTFAKTYEDLSEVSDFVVRAKVGEKENQLVYNEFDSSVYFGYTTTELLIKEVYLGSLEEEKIKVTEDYFIAPEKEDKKTVIFSQGSYLPAKKGETYIFFLRKYGEDSKYKGMYGIVDLEFGKYPVRASKETKESLELKDDKIIEKYREWYQKVKRDYIEN